MPKYNVKIPQGLYKINADNRKDAIDQALEIYKMELANFVKDGRMYAIPDICRLHKRRDAVGELAEVDAMQLRRRKVKRRR